jgi:tRNA threonylcarbamoyladenosine biosynthesis protein TsaB
MMILALEFSAAERSVALARDGRVLAAARETGPRGTNAFSLISRVLAEAGVRREEVETIAVGLGPGSYTGIRVAVSVAQGWQLARPVRLLGVDAVTTLTTQAQAAGIFGQVNVLIDAQRGEYYLATWELTASERREITPLRLVPTAGVKPGPGEIYLGPDAPRVGGTLMYPAADTVVQLAAQCPRPGVGETLEPVYLRESTFVKWQPAIAPGVAGI